LVFWLETRTDPTNLEGFCRTNIPRIWNYNCNTKSKPGNKCIL